MKTKKPVKGKAAKPKRVIAKSPKSKRLLPKQNPRKAAIKKHIRQQRPIHRRLMLHPVSLMVLLCAAVFLVSWTFHAGAIDVAVTASVPAAPLGQGAVIDSPYDNAVITSAPIVVSGSCPNGSYIKLYRNSIFSGVDWCSPTNTFSITTDLFVGKNVLLAQDYNVTDAPGPITPTVTLTYVPPAATTVIPSGPTTTSNTPSGGSKAPSVSTSRPSTGTSAPPLFLGSDFYYQTVPIGQSFSWTITINGGKQPYSLLINWGDGLSSKMTIPTDPTFTLNHSYKHFGYYDVIVNVTDANNAKTILQLAALVRTPGEIGIFKPGAKSISPIGSSSISSNGGSANNFLQIISDYPAWIKLAWPSLIIVALMLFSFWIGEREEYRTLAKRKHIRAH